MNRGAIAEIDLSAIAHNLRYTKKIVHELPVIGVVKADAYGHGAIRISKKLTTENISFLAVAFTGEAIELREAGINIPILVLFETEDIHYFFNYSLIPVISQLKLATSLSSEAMKRNAQIKVHVKIDTGMGRLGLYSNRILEDLLTISELPGLELSGILSHFSEADLSDKSYAALQLQRFNSIRHSLSQQLNRNVFSHIANSAAVLAFEEAHLDAVRPGLMLYGYLPFSQIADRAFGNTEKQSEIRKPNPANGDLIPAMKIKTRILCIRKLPSGTPISYGRTYITQRPSMIGVLPLGYADGYNRLFSNNANVIVREKRVPIVGRICMDLTMIDLTDVKDVEEHDEVVIMGKQGNEFITAEELAKRAHTIPYEILTSLGSKAARTYVEAP